jgi:hypothetical protein
MDPSQDNAKLMLEKKGIYKAIPFFFSRLIVIEMKRALFVLIMGLLLLLMSMIVGCESGISVETHTFLSRMHNLDAKWDKIRYSSDYFFNDIFSFSYDELISEITALEPPYESVEYIGTDFYLPQEHAAYVAAMRLSVSAERNAKSFRTLLESWCEQRLQDPYWAQLYDGVGDCIESDSHNKNAESLWQQASSAFTVTRLKWNLVFEDYGLGK